MSVRDLQLRKISFDKAFGAKSIDLRGTAFRLSGDVRINGAAELVEASEQIRVRGHIAGKLERDCDRCLETAPLPVDRDFDLLYRPADTDTEFSEAELAEADTEIGYYDGFDLELADVLREQLVLWLPLHWVCSEGCRGICPVCGINRNKRSCECAREETDDRWSALRNLRPANPG